MAQAIEAGRLLLETGIYPMIPHLNHLYSRQMVRQGGADLSHAEYLAWDEEILVRCDGMWKLADSPGADHEEAVARAAGLPVFTTLAGVRHYSTCDDCIRTGGRGWNQIDWGWNRID